MASEKGKCEVCGKQPRVLTPLESGQKVCVACLREFRPPRPKHMATYRQIDRLRENGIAVGDDLTKEEFYRLDGEWRKKQPQNFEAALAGALLENPNGENRQNIIRKCRRGDKLILIREPDNKMDSGAVLVSTSGGSPKQRRVIGWLSLGNDLADRFPHYLDAGGKVEAEISEIYGGQKDGIFGKKKPYAVDVSVTWWPALIDW